MKNDEHIQHATVEQKVREKEELEQPIVQFYFSLVSSVCHWNVQPGWKNLVSAGNNHRYWDNNDADSENTLILPNIFLVNNRQPAWVHWGYESFQKQNYSYHAEVERDFHSKLNKVQN